MAEERPLPFVARLAIVLQFAMNRRFVDVITIFDATAAVTVATILCIFDIERIMDIFASNKKITGNVLTLFVELRLMNGACFDECKKLFSYVREGIMNG